MEERRISEDRWRIRGPVELENQGRWVADHRTWRVGCLEAKSEIPGGDGGAPTKDQRIGRL